MVPYWIDRGWFVRASSPQNLSIDKMKYWRVKWPSVEFVVVAIHCTGLYDCSYVRLVDLFVRCAALRRWYFPGSSGRWHAAAVVVLAFIHLAGHLLPAVAVIASMNADWVVNHKKVGLYDNKSHLVFCDLQVNIKETFFSDLAENYLSVDSSFKSLKIPKNNWRCIVNLKELHVYSKVNL